MSENSVTQVGRVKIQLVSELFQRDKKIKPDPIRLSLGCPVLDSTLDGGISPSGITEICGEAGVGKTQLLLRLLLTVQLPYSHGGLDGKAIFISAEGMPVRRLSQMAEYMIRHKYPGADTTVSEMMSSVFLHECQEANELWDLLTYNVPILMQQKKVKLVVLDSIAAVFRTEFGYTKQEFRERTLWLTSLSSKLRELSHKYGAAIVIANQVSSSLNGELNPALGLTWSNCINSRIMLRKSEDITAVLTESTPTQTSKEPVSGVRVLPTRPRRLEIKFSPIHRETACSYVVEASGLTGVAS